MNRYGASVAKPARTITRQATVGKALLLIAALWVVVLFDPQWLLASLGAPVLLKLPVILYITLGLTLAIGVPSIPRWRRRWDWYVPLLCFILTGAVMLPFAINRGLARDEVQFYLLLWTLVVGTVALVDSVRRAEILVSVYGLQFIWWGLWGAATGRVGWHPTLGNEDGFGSFMAIGVGLCSFLIVAAEKKSWLRRAMVLALALSIIGVVASFARGAALATFAIFGLIWLRSPRKGMTLAAGIGGLLIVMIAASLLHADAFWAEIQSVFTEGTEEGTTGEDRWVLWMAAWDVFLQRPLFGVGPDNFGVFAAGFFEFGELGSRYADAARLYNRSLHSAYFTILSEQGIAGIAAFLWIVWDFWRRNATLRTDAAQEAWRAMGGRLQLRAVALGLEAAFVAWLLISTLYDQSGKHWFFTILAMNLLLHSLIVKQAGRARVPRRVPRGKRSARR